MEQDSSNREEADLDSQDAQPQRLRRRRSDYPERVTFPDWLKLSVSVAGTAITTTALVILWVNGTFATKAELVSHNQQQLMDLSRLSSNQKDYADAEKGTSGSLGKIDARLTGIEAKMEIVLDSLPSPSGKVKR
jgi:hypothetical protein